MMKQFLEKSLTKAFLFLIISLVVSGLADPQPAPTSKSYPITTLINAKWGQTPLHLEIAEYLADENPNLYWDFLKDITELDTTLSGYGEFKSFHFLETILFNLKFVFF